MSASLIGILTWESGPALMVDGVRSFDWFLPSMSGNWRLLKRAQGPKRLTPHSTKNRPWLEDGHTTHLVRASGSFYLVNKMKKGWLIGFYWYACILTGNCEEIVKNIYKLIM